MIDSDALCSSMDAEIMDSHTELCVCQWMQSRTGVSFWLPTSVCTLCAKSDSVACCCLVVSWSDRHAVVDLRRIARKVY